MLIGPNKDARPRLDEAVEVTSTLPGDVRPIRAIMTVPIDHRAVYVYVIQLSRVV